MKVCCSLNNTYIVEYIIYPSYLIYCKLLLWLCFKA